MKELFGASTLSLFFNFITSTLLAQSPDIVITDVSLSRNSLPRLEGVEITVTLLNQGDAPSTESFWIGYQLNTENTFDKTKNNSRILKGPALGINESKAVTIPAFRREDDPGSYFLFVNADDQNDINESNENNNFSTSLELEITVDDVQLGISNLFLSPSTINKFASSQDFDIGFSISNTGSTKILYSGVNAYLSPLQEAESAQRMGVLVFINADGFAPGDNRNFTLTTSAPRLVNSGKYIVEVIADQPSSDNNLENNKVASTIIIQNGKADLSISNIRFPQGDSVTAGDQKTILYDIKNDTDYSILHSFKHKTYLSSNKTLDNDDILLLDWEVNDQVFPNNSIISGGSAIIPLETVPGSYFLLFIIDEENLIEEIDETNNIGSAAITILANLPDLSISDINIRFESTIDGPKLDSGIYLSVINNGKSAVSNFDVSIYLSIDSEWNEAEDTLIGMASFSEELDVRETVSMIIETMVPEDIPVGSYRLITVIDKTNDVKELNEEDNILVGDEMVTISPPVISFSDEVLASKVIITPNPIQDKIQISSERLGTIETVKLVSAVGKTFTTQIRQTHEALSLEVRSLPKGIYLVEIMFNDGSSVVKRLIKN